MASVQERLKLKRAPTDIWSIREQLCLASSVLKSGDQNWMSVSRSLKSVVDKDSIRPLDWFSQKSCAQQYAYLIENSDLPKRKKRESGETTSESIVRKLTQNRILELEQIMKSKKDEYQQMKNEIILLRDEIILNESKLQELWLAIEKKEEQKQKTENPQIEINTEDAKIKVEYQEITSDEISENKNKKSALLTSLLKSTSSQTQQSLEETSIDSLLCSDSKTLGMHHHLNQEVTRSNIISTTERLSANAPTLSMLLEQPSQSQNMYQGYNDSITMIEVRSDIKSHEDPLEVGATEKRIIQSSKRSHYISNTESQQNSSNPVNEVVTKLLNKDEMNEIMGDLEELINEEITNSPEISEPCTISPSVNLVTVNSKALIEFSSPSKSINPSNSLSDSPNSEISIGEIDSSTSNIAEIIGTNLESKCNDDHCLEFEENKFEDSKIEKIKSTNCELEIVQTKNSSESVQNTKENNIDDSLRKKEYKSFDEKVEFQEKEKNVNSETLGETETNKEVLIPSGNENSSINITKLFLQRKESGIKQYMSNTELTSRESFTSKLFTKEQSDECRNLKISNKSESYDLKEIEETAKLMGKEYTVRNDSVKEIKCTQILKEVEKSNSFNNDQQLKNPDNVIDNMIIFKPEGVTNKTEQVKNNFSKIFKEVGQSCESKKLEDEIIINLTEKESSELVAEETSEEHPILNKLSGGKLMKTYSKKQNAAIDYETENETSGETADNRAWKKSIMPVYNSLATHKYASIFLRPITEDQAPGYHSIIFRPMDLYTIKKNIDNGTIRSTKHFQRDVMLMFQNAIMYNKQNTFVHKMTLEMQDECLQHMQVLVRAAGEASFRRETRTGSGNSSETAESSIKRKWIHLISNTGSSHDMESPRVKKWRKSEND